jgi:hypothetical protein
VRVVGVDERYAIGDDLCMHAKHGPELLGQRAANGGGAGQFECRHGAK